MTGRRRVSAGRPAGGRPASRFVIRPAVAPLMPWH
jgi:hypothetical protein